MKFNDVSMNPFYEQPPLFSFITGGFYKIFGNSFFADKFLTVIFLGVSVFLLYKICKIIFKKISFFEIVLFFLITVPVLCWSYINQVIESLVLPLTLLGFYAFLSSRKKPGMTLKNIFYLLLFSFTVIALFLTKGFQSCFIVVTPFLYFFILKDKKALLFGIMSAIIVSTLLYLLLFVYEPSSLWFSNYMQKRLLATLNNVGATTTDRAEIILRTITELTIPIALSFFALVFCKIKKENIPVKDVIEKKTAWILLLIGLSGSAPFAITLEQRGFYLVPAFPFLILAMVLFFKPYLKVTFEIVISFFKNRKVAVAAGFLFLFSVGYLIASPNLYKRDENLIKDLKLINFFLKQKDTISVDEDTWNHTALQAYLYMQNRVNVEVDNSHRFYIHDREHNTIPNSNYTKVNINTKQFDLFLKIDSRK